MRQIRFDFTKLYPTETFACTLRADRDSVYLWQDLRDVLFEMNVETEYTVPYAHWMLGKCERMWRTLTYAAQAMMSDCGLPKQFWHYAILAAVHIKNRSYSTGAGPSGGIPYELLYGRPPNLSPLRVFGCLAFVKVPDVQKRKFTPSAVPKVFLGYSPLSPGYIVFDPVLKSISVTCHVTFDEARFPFIEESSFQTSEDIFASILSTYESIINPTQPRNPLLTPPQQTFPSPAPPFLMRYPPSTLTPTRNPTISLKTALQQLQRLPASLTPTSTAPGFPPSTPGPLVPTKWTALATWTI